MKEIIRSALAASVDVKQQFVSANSALIIEGARLLADCLTNGGKTLWFGNGGSAADAQHLAAEFVNRFQIERPPLAGLALTTDTSIITAIGNDYHFDEIFEKQILALGQQGDVALGISTSGNSPNVVRGIRAARKQGLKTIAITGHGGKVAGLADIVYKIESDTTARIQETHIFLGHLLCDLVDRIMFPDRF